MSYDAFISYSRHDIRVARWLQSHIQNRKLPTTLAKRLQLGRRRLDRVFRDETDLGGAAGLTESLTTALDLAECLIVVCSPYAAASEYVDQEIRHFQSLGRGDRILCIIAGGNPEDDGPLQCFPPAIRESGAPMAADLRSDPDRYSDVEGDKIVAGMLGVSLRDLSAADERSRHGRMLVAGALASAVVAAGAVAWDGYQRDHVDFYRHLVSRDGLWVGVGEISSEQARRRSQVFEIHRKGRFGLPARIELTNGIGGRPADPFVGMLEEPLIRNCHGQGAFTLLIEYIDGRVVEERWTNSRGLEYEKVLYPESAVVAEFREGSFGCTRTPSGIEYVQTRFDDSGYPATRVFMDGDRQPAMNERLAFGYEYQVDAQGLPTSIRSLGASGQYRADKNGYFEIVYERDANGDIVQMQYRDLTGMPTVGPEICATLRYALDPDGRRVRTECRDADGHLTTHEDGFAVKEATFDESGNEVSVAYFDPEGQGTVSYGVGKLERRFDDRGQLTEEHYFAPDGSPEFNDFGGHISRLSYDDAGMQIEWRIFDEQDRPVLSTDDRSFLRRTGHDDHGRIAAYAVFDVNGEPSTGRQGVHRWIYGWDDRGRRNRIEMFDADGERMNGPNGFAVWEAEYDARGNEVKRWFVDPDGKPTTNDDGIGIYQHEYDNQGRRIATRYFSPDGSPMLDGREVAGERSEFDGRGNEIKRTFIGLDGEPSANNEGVWGLIRTYDLRGNVLKELNLGKDGEVVLGAQGTAGFVHEFDARGKELLHAFVDVNEKPVEARDTGLAGRRYRYDARGNQVSLSYFGLNGEPKASPDGIHDMVDEYDERGLLTRRSYLDPDGQLVNAPWGYAGRRQQYDSRSREIERVYFGADGRPVMSEVSEPYRAIEIRRFNRHGQLALEIYYDAEGAPVETEPGVWGKSRVYARDGSWTHDEKPLDLADLNQLGLDRYEVTPPATADPISTALQ